MKKLLFWSTLCCLWFLQITPALAQQFCFTETFDDDSNILYDSDAYTAMQWQVVDYGAANSFTPVFAWDDNGAADNGTYWNNRQAIQSPSGGGSFNFNPDDSNLVFIINRGPAVFRSGQLISPRIDLPAGGPASPLFLSFYQYYRSYRLNYSSVDICLGGDCGGSGESWVSIYNNHHVGSGYETPNGQKISLNISKYLYDWSTQTWADSFRVRFNFNGEYYFWILDDVSICEGNIVNPRPMTDPPELGIMLSAEHDYQVDDDKNPYVPDQLVAEFEPLTKEADRDSIRKSLGVDTFIRCSCNLNLELWKFNIDPDSDSDQVSAIGDTIIKLQDVIKSSKPKTGLLGDDVIYNYYTHSDYSKSSDFPFDTTGLKPLTALPHGITPRDSGEIVVAHPDTGLDFTDPELARFLWRNDSNPPYPGDLFGHNFVNDNNNVFDNNTHGDRTARLVTNQLPFLNCSYKIMVLKTHDQDGFGTLFNNTCALYYALNQGAHVVQTAFAWKGAPNNIMLRAIDSLGVVGHAHFVSASGNDSLPLPSKQIFPSVYNRPNQTNVASVAPDSTLSPFSNHSPDLVKIGANGEKLRFEAYPGNEFSGTSYAAPQVASALAALICLYGEDIASTRQRLFDCSFKIPSLEPFIEEGRVLNYNFPCLYPNAVAGRLIYALTGSNTLISFDSDKPSVIRSATPLRGVQPPKKIAGIDFRTISGELFALAYDQSSGRARLYAIDLESGLASPVGTQDVLLKPGMGQVGFDMNPVTDQWRVSGDDGSNFRLSAVDGSLIGTDSPLTFAPGDLHAGVSTQVGSIAYDNNIDGAATTKLYAYDDSLNLLLRLNAPQNGQLQTIGQTMITLDKNDASADLDLVFDLNTGQNSGFLSANTRNEVTDNLYRLDLQSGKADLIGPIGSRIPVRDIAIFLKEPKSACEVKIVGCMRYEVLRVSSNQELERTYRIRITNNCLSPMVYAAFGLPKGVVAVSPQHNGTYASVSGHTYETRNPNFSGFYSVRFKDQGTGIQNGQADVFEYTLPPYSQPEYILVKTPLADHNTYEVYLTLGDCDINSASVQREGAQVVAPLRENTVSLWPNPSPGFIMVEAGGQFDGELQLRLLNPLGQSLWTSGMPAGSGSALFVLPEDINNGIYFFEISDRSGYLSTQRLVLKK